MKAFGKTLLMFCLLVGLFFWVIYVDRNGGFPYKGLLLTGLIVAVFASSIYVVHRFGGRDNVWRSALVAVGIVVVGGILLLYAVSNLGWDGFKSSIVTLFTLIAVLAFAWLAARGLPASAEDNGVHNISS